MRSKGVLVKHEVRSRRTLFALRKCFDDRKRSVQPRKKPTWRNTRRCSTTSAYSLTGHPDCPRCHLSSHPTQRCYHPTARLGECNVKCPRLSGARVHAGRFAHCDRPKADAPHVASVGPHCLNQSLQRNGNRQQADVVAAHWLRALDSRRDYAFWAVSRRALRRRHD